MSDSPPSPSGRTSRAGERRPDPSDHAEQTEQSDGTDRSDQADRIGGPAGSSKQTEDAGSPGGSEPKGRPPRSTAEPPGPDPPDTDAIARAQAGDHEAFRVLVERYQGRAYRLALRVLRDEDLARDAVQDAFLKAYAALDRFEGRSSFYTWLYRLVMNRCLDMKRRDRSSRHVEWDEERAVEAAEGAGTAAEAGRGTPEAQLERSELRALVARAIEELPEDARRIIQLREIDDLSYAEIADILGVPKGTVMSRLHYARRRVREALEVTGAMDWVTEGEAGGST